MRELLLASPPIGSLLNEDNKAFPIRRKRNAPPEPMNHGHERDEAKGNKA